MLTVETIGRIRREHFIKGKTIREISRDLKVSRNTVRKVLRSGETSFEYERDVQPRPKLGRWTAELDELLEGNTTKPFREQLTLIRIFEELRGRGYDGGYDAVRRYARRWAKERGQSTAAAYVPLSFAPGEAYQFDWSHEVVLLSGVAADALIAGCYLAGTNTRRVRRALASLFGGAVGKDTVSRVWRKVKSDWDAWNARALAAEPIVRLILDGTVVRVRLDRKATAISLLVVIGVRTDGQKVMLAVKAMGSESTEAWRAVLDDLVRRDLRRPEFLIVDGAPGLDSAIAAVWDGVPMQRCTVHKHRNLLAHAPERLHEEITADYNDMIYAVTREEIEAHHKAFIHKWRLKHRAVAVSLEEAGEWLFTFTRLPPSQWRSARTTNAIERLHEEFKRRIKTQTVLPSADTAAMLFWALLASGQISMRKVDGWQTLPIKPIDQPIDLAA